MFPLYCEHCDREIDVYALNRGVLAILKDVDKIIPCEVTRRITE